MLPVSARTKQGMPELLEYIALQAEVLELTSNPEKPAVGVVIEAKLEKGRGPVATVLVQEGTIRTGDAIVTGTEYGKVRAMMNERGEQVKEIPPGYPVEILGLSGVPTAGDEVNVVEDEKAAKEVAEHRAVKARAKELGTVRKATLEDLFAKAKTGGQKELNIVIKADVQGSAEAVSQALQKLATKKVGVRVLNSGVGVITESSPSSTRRSTRSARRWRTSSSPSSRRSRSGRPRSASSSPSRRSRGSSPARRSWRGRSSAARTCASCASAR
jgi:translation initiation factor IF-2